MHERSKERAGARVKYFNLAGGRLAPLSRHDRNHARRLLLAGQRPSTARAGPGVPEEVVLDADLTLTLVCCVEVQRR